MRFYISQKPFCWGGKYHIRDEDGNLKYTVVGKIQAFTRRLYIYNSNDSEVAVVGQKRGCLYPNFSVCQNGTIVAEIKRGISFLKPKYIVGGLNWTVDGDFDVHNYRIHQGDKTIAVIKKAWISWGDNYEIDILHQEDEIIALAAVIVIDCMTESGAD